MDHPYFCCRLGIGVGTFGTLVGIGGLIYVRSSSCSCRTASITSSTWPRIAGTSLVVVNPAYAGGVGLHPPGAYLQLPRHHVHNNHAPGAVLGSWIVNKFSTPMLDLYFGIFLLLMSIIMYWNSTHKPVSNIMELPKDFQYNRTLGIVASLGVGFLSSIFGIGGGVIHVPLMIYLLGFPVHVATATSHFVLACSSAFGVISHFMLDHIIWVPAICISIGAAIGAQIGAKLSKKTKSKVILMLLSLAMFALGIRLILLGSAH